MAGSYANVNTYVCKGQNVVSSKAFNRKNSNTSAQQLQRASFKLIADAYVMLGGFVDMGFPQRDIRQSAYNVFMSLNLPGAVDSTGDEPVINYSKLVVARGSLPQLDLLQASVSTTGIRLQFESSIALSKASADDVVITLVKRAGRVIKSVQTARGEAELLQVDVALPGITKEEVEFIYVFVISKDGSKASNSMLVELA